MFVRHLFALLVSLCAASMVFAAPEKDEKDQPEPAPANSAEKPSSPAAADYAAKLKQWKGLIAKLTQIRERYQQDPAADKKELEEQFTATLKEAQALAPVVTEAAELAYVAAPNEDRELNDFLIASLRGMIVGDEYERAAKLSKILIDNNFESKDLPVWAGLAFFATNDFENARKYMKLAVEQSEPTRDQALEANRRNAARYLSTLDETEKAWQAEQAVRAKEAQAKDLPRIKFHTSKGDVVVELFENEAPIATSNMINLVEKGYYDGLKFHRVLPGFMAQGGDPAGDGSGGPGYTIPDECYQDNHRNHFRGSLSMAKTQEKDTGGSQFFLCFVPTTYLDGKHTVFGRVVEGMDVLSKLQRIQPGDPGNADTIEKATVLSKRKHKYETVKKADKKK